MKYILLIKWERQFDTKTDIFEYNSVRNRTRAIRLRKHLWSDFISYEKKDFQGNSSEYRKLRNIRKGKSHKIVRR